MNPGIMVIFFGLVSGFIGYMIGLEVQQNRQRTKRGDMYQWTWMEGEHRDAR